MVVVWCGGEGGSEIKVWRDSIFFYYVASKVIQEDFVEPENKKKKRVHWVVWKMFYAPVPEVVYFTFTHIPKQN